ncbi:zincin-like metallopeptidase domain-containing protein, partial [Vibrio parahaemolyticus]
RGTGPRSHVCAGVQRFQRGAGRGLCSTNHRSPVRRCADAERRYLWGNLGIECRHGGNEAYYIPSEDRVQMPPFAQFREPAAYYGTLFH